MNTVLSKGYDYLFRYVLSILNIAKQVKLKLTQSDSKIKLKLSKKNTNSETLLDTRITSFLSV